jgi:rubrerythrin
MNDYMLDAANEMRHEAAVERLVEEHGPDREFTRDEIEDAALQLDAGRLSGRISSPRNK